MHQFYLKDFNKVTLRCLYFHVVVCRWHCFKKTPTKIKRCIHSHSYKQEFGNSGEIFIQNSRECDLKV